MADNLIHDRGRGPEIVGTRITVYNLVPYFLDPTATEDYICRVYQLNAEQVAAARAYVLNNADTVLARHVEIEARIAAGNPPEVIERAKQIHANFIKFKNWLAQQQEKEAQEKADSSMLGNARTETDRIPTFQEWLAERDMQQLEKGP